MRIILYEMKKIWNIKMLGVILLLCTLFYSIFMEFGIKYFPNGHPITEEIDYSIELTERYGTTLEAEEFSDFMRGTREARIAEAEKYIAINPVFSEVGIHNYADYEAVHEKREQTQAESQAIWTLLGEETDFVQFKLNALDRVEERYDNYPVYTLQRLISEATSERELARLVEIQENETYRNIMDGHVFGNTVDYAVRLAILAVLSVFILISPLIVTDRARMVHLLQYTAKHGRKILYKQLIAVMLSTFALTTILLFVFGMIYSRNGTWPFWNNGLTSFLNLFTDVFWFDITYGQYIIAYIILLYIVCLGAAAIAFILSRFSQSLITLLFKLIPAFAVFGALGFGIFFSTFSSTNMLYMGTGIIGLEPVVSVLILAAGLAASLYMMLKEKKADVHR